MKVNAVVVEKSVKTGIERYSDEVLPYLAKYVDLRVTRIKTKEAKIFGRPIGGYLGLWMQQQNVYKQDGEVLHSLGVLPFRKGFDIMNVYDLVPWKFLYIYQRSLPQSVGYAMALQAVQATPRIITMSKHVKRELVQMCGRSPDDVYVIPGGVDWEKFRPLRDVDKTTRTVLFVGEDNPRKNLGKLIEGLALCDPPPCLVWAGGNHWSAERDSVRGLAAHLRVPLAELGYISDEELVGWYNKANLLVHPTLDEGGAFPALEAMACGLPAAVSNIPPLKEELGKLAFYFDPHSPEDIARTIQEGLDVSKNEVELVEYVRRNYNWDLTARKTVEVYEEVFDDMGN